MVVVNVQVKGAKPVVLNLDGTVQEVTVADVKRGVQKQITKVRQVKVVGRKAFRTQALRIVVSAQWTIADSQFVPNRQRLTLAPTGKEKPVALTDDKQNLAQYGLSGNEVTVRLKDLGYQVAYRALYIWEYVRLCDHSGS